MATLPGVSMRRVCRVLKFPRAQVRARAASAVAPPRLDEVLAERIQRLVETTSDFWLPPAVGAAALRRGHSRKPQGRCIDC